MAVFSCFRIETSGIINTTCLNYSIYLIMIEWNICCITIQQMNTALKDDAGVCYHAKKFRDKFLLHHQRGHLMKIKSSEIQLASSRSYQEQTTVKAEYKMEWETIFNNKLQERLNPDRFYSETFLQNSIQTYKERLISMAENAFSGQVSDTTGIFDANVNDRNTPANPLLESIIEKMISMEILIQEFTDFKYDFQYINRESIKPASGNLTFEAKYKIYEDRVVTHQENENTRFISNGVIETEDGESVNFVMNLDMKREYMSQEKYSYVEEGAMTLIDPLVINFDGSIPELADFRFSFDLNFDGQNEEFASFKDGTGFLALDLNADGKVNDGRELFGPSTGSGFGELAQYDADHNNWIDENDTIFDQLSIWTPDENGNGQISSIRDKGIGAIYLDQADTRFDLRDTTNMLAAQIRKTSVVLNENGTVGTIQELDMNSGVDNSTYEKIS